jgi:O-antigen/teichoic acid export membrane protein
MVATISAAAMAYLAHEWVFQIIVGEKYHDYSLYMPFVVLAAGVLQVSLSLSISVTAQNNTHLLLWNSTVGNGIIIILNLCLTSVYGVSGLIAGMTLGSTIHLAWMARIVRISGAN